VRRYDNLIAREAYKGALQGAAAAGSRIFPPRYNIAPTDQIPIVRVDPRDGTRELTLARWGLIPFWMKERPKVPHINARAETVHKAPLFREAFAKRRALVPATGFLRVAEACRRQAALPFRAERPRALRLREPVEFTRLPAAAAPMGRPWRTSFRRPSSSASPTRSLVRSTTACR